MSSCLPLEIYLEGVDDASAELTVTASSWSNLNKTKNPELAPYVACMGPQKNQFVLAEEFFN